MELCWSHISIDLNGAPAPQKYKLVVGLDGAKFENDWDVWVYPSELSGKTNDVLITAKFDENAQDALRSGRNVLLTIPGKEVRNYDKDPVKLGFSSIFWNTAWTGRQAPTTLGILCDPKNPALVDFPTDYYSDWQWWYLIHRAGALRLDLLPKGLDPIVRVIDDWVTAYPLGLIVEGKMGSGKIIICGFDLTHNAPMIQFHAKCVRVYLNYMSSEKFAPQTELTIDQIGSLISDKSKP